jgi:hypothetical protein
MRGFFDVEVLVLARSAFGGDYSAMVHLFEIPAKVKLEALHGRRVCV